MLPMHQSFAANCMPQDGVINPTEKILNDILQNMACRSNISNSQVSHYVSASAFEKQETEKLQNVLDVALISGASSKLEKSAEALALTALALDMKDTSQTSFLLAMNRQQRENFAIIEQKRKLFHKQSQLGKRMSFCQEKINTLQKETSHLQDIHTEQCAEKAKRKKQQLFVQEKLEEYRKRKNKLEENLQESGVEASLTHPELAQKKMELSELEKKLDCILSSLKAYNNLPANINQAKLKIEETRQELEKLEEAVAKII